MSLTLYFHPLSSFCHKALIALYENDIAFKPLIIDLGNEQSRAQLLKVWPMGKFPVLRDDAKDRTIPEATIIIEYLAQHYPGKTKFVPEDADIAREMRLRDRFFDLYVNTPMQKIVTDKLRPAGQNDSFGVEQARSQLAIALDMIERDIQGKTWMMGDEFTMADCAAAPGLFYANMVAPFVKTHPSAAAYLQRLQQRSSYARVLKEAEPYFAMLPK